ncbi:ATP-binding cassette domain-containing protein [Acidipropionibacterium timonense]|uniref:ATP-binding cassette domain-containing protein n=1 Tax=Acidipropionibacterium timonense TaxID=2161818 RepID=UPI0010319AEA|nr:ABC transporter ATP-binding protein [Acidipropionibacterium timonense]
MWQLDPLDRQRLRLCFTLLSDPELPCVDDVTALHGPDDQRRLWDCLERVRAGGTTVVAATTNPDTIPGDVLTVPMTTHPEN